MKGKKDVDPWWATQDAHPIASFESLLSKQLSYTKLA